MAQPKRQWLPEEDEELLRSYRAGTLISHIASKLNRPIGSISSRLRTLKEPERGTIAFNKGVGRGVNKSKQKEIEAPVKSQIGTILRPRPGVLIHLRKE